MIHSEYGYTVKDCRTEQRQTWDKIRYDERMKIEKKGREETVARRRERSRMKRAHKETQWLNSAEQAAEPVKALPDRYLVKALQDELHYSKDNHEAKKKRAAHTGRALALKNLKSQLKKDEPGVACGGEIDWPHGRQGVLIGNERLFYKSGQ